MSSSVVVILVQLVAGAAGATAAVAVLRDLNLGTLRNILVGAVGGVLAGQLMMALAPAVEEAAGDFDAIASQAFGCVVGGAVVVAIIALIKNRIFAS